MSTIDHDIWLPTPRRMPSPNADERPNPDDISLLVVHNISLPPGEFGGSHVEDLFLNRLDRNGHPYFEQIADLRVSSHLLVRRDGQAIQFVPLNRRAWHAGVSEFEGRCACNDFSIGIELEGSDDVPFTTAQYDVLAALTGEVMQRFSAITLDRVVGHSDIAPGRKTDPGPEFDWAHFRGLLREDSSTMR